MSLKSTMSPKSKSKDTLLSAAQVLIVLCVVAFIFVMAMILIGLGAVLTVQRHEVFAELGEIGAPDAAYWAIVAALVLLEAIFGCLTRFFLELGDIVKSVDLGDPFQPANADRLHRMGWLATAAYVLGIALGSIANWIESVAKDASRLDIDYDVGGGGLLIILVLFILARVFRQGAAMRADLEGTV